MGAARSLASSVGTCREPAIVLRDVCAATLFRYRAARGCRCRDRRRRHSAGGRITRGCGAQGRRARHSTSAVARRAQQHHCDAGYNAAPTFYRSRRRRLAMGSDRTRAVARRGIVFARLCSVLGGALARTLYRQIGCAAIYPCRRDDCPDRRRRPDGPPVGLACTARVRRGCAKFRSKPPVDRYPLRPRGTLVLRRPLRAHRRHAAA